MKPSDLDNLALGLRGKKILLGITGSIAAFKAVDIVRHLRDCGADVQVILTQAGGKFVTRWTLETLSGNPVRQEVFDDGQKGTHHIDLARWADLFLVAPASANTIAKMAAGFGDSLLLTEYLAYRGPLLLAPAMNPEMWRHPSVIENLKTLTGRGVQILPPELGPTACGEVGEGRMIEASTIVAAAFEVLCPPVTQRALITMGPTRAELDPVRYLTNRSSGKMGAALAWSARASGVECAVVTGIAECFLPPSSRVISVRTTDQMFHAVAKEWATHRFDFFFCAAAVVDWQVKRQPKKVKKQDLQLKWEPSQDILAYVGAHKKSGQRVVGFAAETENWIKNGEEKRRRKNCDALFVNDVSRGKALGTDTNAGWWLEEGVTISIGEASKSAIASQILGLAQKLNLAKEASQHA